MSKNITFFILLLTAVILTYLLNPALSVVIEAVITERLPRDFVRLLQNSDLVSFSGSVGIFGLLFLMLYLIFPVTYVWYHISSARNVIANLPLAHNPAARTDKKTFLAQLLGHGFIHSLAEKYSIYLIQEAKQEVKEEDLKSSRIIKRNVSQGENEKQFISPVKALAPAEIMFNVQSLVHDNLILGFFRVFSGLIFGVGVVCLGISMVGYSLQPSDQATALLPSLQPGLVSLLICLTAAIIVSGFSRSVYLILSHNAKALARNINDLFNQNEWQRDMNKMAINLSSEDDKSPQLAEILQKSLNRPMEEITKAVQALSADQEEKLNGILSKTLTTYSRQIDDKTAADTAKLNDALRKASETTEKMAKQFTEAQSEFDKQLTKQASALSKNLQDMQKALQISEKKSQKEIEKVISTLTSEVDKTYKRSTEFLESSFQGLEKKQAQIDETAQNKDSILKDLRSSAKDLGTISNASAKLLEKFTALSSELDVVLTAIQESGIHKLNGGGDKRERLKSALKNLKKVASDKIGELPDM